MNIEKLLTLRNKTKESLSKAIGVTTNSIRSYERGEHQPPLDVVIKMAEFFGVSLETVAGIENDIIDKKMLKEEKRKLVEEILNLESSDVNKVLAFIAGINSTKND